jgi:hypothetical protein
MHPEISASAQGQCPICKMALEPRGSVAPQAGMFSLVQLSRHAYACPMHPEIGGSEKGTCSSCKMALVRVDPKRSLPEASAEANARFGPGVTWLPETAPPVLPTRPEDAPALGTVQRREFVDRVVASAFLETREQLAALLYRDDLVGLSADEPATFRRSTHPRELLPVRRTSEPPVPWDATTVLIRFRLQAPVGPSPLAAGEAGFLELGDHARKLLVVPESALLRSTEGAYVLVPRAGGGIERRLLELGRTRKGLVAVLGGLVEGERIVVGSAFFVDIEQRSQARMGVIVGMTP